jgi:hypothetical protein
MRLLYLALLATTAVAAPAFAQSVLVHVDEDTAGVQDSDLEMEPDYSALIAMFPDGLPSLLSPQSYATAYKMPGHLEPPKDPKLPTKIGYADGPMKWDVNSTVTTRKTTTSVVPMTADPRTADAAGGTGEVKGEVRYSAEQWEFYGAQRFGTNQADGLAPTFSETTVLGSLYKLPDSFGGKIGASVELNSADERKARVEYRRPIGPAEGFIAAEQTYPAVPVDQPPAAVRAGVNRKF